MMQTDLTTKSHETDESLSTIERTVSSDYKYGFVTAIEADEAPMGLNEDIIRFISAKKKEPEWMLEWRLKAYRQWLGMAGHARAQVGAEWTTPAGTVQGTVGAPGTRAPQLGRPGRNPTRRSPRRSPTRSSPDRLLPTRCRTDGWTRPRAMPGPWPVSPSA